MVRRMSGNHGGVRGSAILPGYDDLIVVLETLPLLIREARRRKRMSLRAVGECSVCRRRRRCAGSEGRRSASASTGSSPYSGGPPNKAWPGR